MTLVDETLPDGTIITYDLDDATEVALPGGLCDRVYLSRRAGLSDQQIAAQLGVTVTALRLACDGATVEPRPSHPAVPRGHQSAPLDLTPYVRPPASGDAGGGGGLAILLLLLLLD